MVPFQTEETLFCTFHSHFTRCEHVGSELSTSWQVVGGADHGGVLVRSGFELTSELAETRLSTGAVVKVGTDRINWRDVDPIFCNVR